jgi:formylglycine-generating enzyme required for sulfatase activity
LEALQRILAEPGTLRIRFPNRNVTVLVAVLSCLASPGRLFSQTNGSGRQRRRPKFEGLPYVWIRPGTFPMGCSPGDADGYDEENLSHAVKISQGFWIGQAAVRLGAYKPFRELTLESEPVDPRL